MVEERALEAWFALEMRRLADALVTAPRSLAELVAEDEPSVPTRSGVPHRFDRDVLRRFHDALGPLDRRRLRLPVTIIVEHETADDAYMTDAVALALLRALGEAAPDADLRDGRYWLGHARARSLASRYPAAFQFSMR